MDKIQENRQEIVQLMYVSICFGTLTVEVLVVVLLCPELAPVDERVGRGEIGHRARVQFAAWNEMGILMKM